MLHAKEEFDYHSVLLQNASLIKDTHQLHILHHFKKRGRKCYLLTAYFQVKVFYIKCKFYIFSTFIQICSRNIFINFC